MSGRLMCDVSYLRLGFWNQGVVDAGDFRGAPPTVVELLAGQDWLVFTAWEGTGGGMHARHTEATVFALVRGGPPGLICRIMVARDFVFSIQHGMGR